MKLALCDEYKRVTSNWDPGCFYYCLLEVSLISERQCGNSSLHLEDPAVEILTVETKTETKSEKYFRAGYEKNLDWCSNRNFSTNHCPPSCFPQQHLLHSMIFHCGPLAFSTIMAVFSISVQIRSLWAYFYIWASVFWEETCILLKLKKQ